MTFFGNPDLYYVHPGYWDDGYAVNPDLTPGEYSGSALTTTAAQWSAQPVQVGAYTGTQLTTAAASWSATGGGIAAYTGSAATTQAATWEASVPGATAFYTGVAASVVAASWAAGDATAAPYTGSSATIGSFTILPPAGWSASGGATAFYSGATVSTAAASITGSGGGTGVYQPDLLLSIAADWEGSGTAEAQYTGAAEATDAATWEAGVTAFYTGTASTPLAADWGATGGAAASYQGGQGGTLAGLWSALAVGDPLPPPQRQPLPPRITRRGFGGSDRVAPDLNAQQYVRFNTVNEPRDLGVIDQDSIVIKDFIGAEAGSQTLFFRFTTVRRAFIGVRALTTTPYAGQYVKTFLFNQQEQQLPSGDISFRHTPPSGRPRIRLTTELVSTGYTDGGYWENGYAEGDGGLTPTVVQLPQEDPPATPLSALPGGSIQPAGTYRVTVTSSDWHKIPFTLQVAARTSSPLRGEIPLFLVATGRLPSQKISGTAELRLEPSATPRAYLRMTASAELKLVPRAMLRRISPF